MIRQPFKARTPEELISLLSAVAMAILAAIIVMVLYYGREIIIPIALAVLLSFVLAPLVRLVQRLRIPRSLAVVSVVVIAFAFIFAMGSLLATQLTQLAGDLPRYQSTISEKIQSFRETTAGRGTLERASSMLKDLSKELDKPKEATNSLGTIAAPKAAAPRPVPVEVLQPDPGALESLQTLISPLLHPLATTGIIVIFVIFILLQREDLRNRLIRLAGSDDLQRTTAALDDAASRLSRLFLIQLLVNGSFGIVIGMGLWLIGVPSAILWGILAAVLRFVPYIGAVIAAAFPLALAVAVDPTWTMLLWTIALFVVVEPVVGHVLEPMVYGHSTGLSPVAVVASATFWTALWGPIGLVLATPLTVCLVVLGRHVERLEFLDVMFGDRPALSPPEIFYQRMLAGDPTEASAKAEEFLKERSLSSYYDEVALRGLQLAQADAERGALDPDRLTKIRDAVQEFANNISEQDERPPPKVGPTTDVEATSAIEGVAEDAPYESLRVLRKEDLPTGWQGEHPVLCVAGRNPIDEAAAIMLAQLTGAHGLSARVEAAEALSTANIFRLETTGVAIVCLVYMDASSPAHMRYSVRRLRRKLPKATIILGCWMKDIDPAALESLREGAKADLAAATLGGALKLCIEATGVDSLGTGAEGPASKITAA
ncbi:MULTISPECIES: AI-2E family transporter [Bradyrhizobium]|uniref:AI-2E family transporter n=1 Tax=Bradyrhizobium TaxID=374 RepID=UPI00039FD329|nr:MULTISPECIES: AI-2E family transporter [Bradyrhizobium]MCK1324383.1 AI-2E family transporter [Bradyrhizobium sp. 156]MCK1349140.1 AI-2E family transporter [Bradyrhizobium sp. CW11]MCK1355901.1 AI-2E family transporter [Bradyrhizobium sp. CW7]MCK1471101.1 AI-2E family transporter [Bradyrhizobium sp. CW10]MCK1488700.1 AI-2E family transporter [Bradyrhizobium sp. 193]MCK1565017.1 AI-2E family transporter [Bradyrhizobium sp. 173]MCK1581749.1 AI-2E family transporter [Bradyrhizobium sp. 168]M